MAPSPTISISSRASTSPKSSRAPDRLDRQLLEVMLSYHASGLAVVAAPNRPAEMRSFDPDVVTRLLDLVSTNFEYVVFDMPRTWFSWTDSVLLGSNKLFIVSETTVPALAPRQATGGGDQGAPRRRAATRRSSSTALRSAVFLRPAPRRSANRPSATAFAGCIPNDYAMVREAIDRGVPLDEVRPGNKITAQLKKLVLERRRRSAAADGSALGAAAEAVPALSSQKRKED